MKRVSIVKRAGEQTAQTAKQAKKNHSEYKNLSPVLKRRVWKYRIIGALITLLGAYIMWKGYGMVETLSAGTVVLIIGIAVWMMSSPQDYNSSTDMAAMIAMDRPRKIEEFYQAYRQVQTPMGSAWLGQFYTMKQTALVFGPDNKGQYVYFWLTKDGNLGYLGYSFIEKFIRKRVTEPEIPFSENMSAGLAGHLSYHSDLMMFQKNLKENLEHFVKTGEVLPFQEVLPSQIYSFTEEYKLTGQRFELHDMNDELVYEIEGTAPLISFRIFDKNHVEVFRMTKELVHALATYRFYLYGEPYGVLEEQFALVKDKFAMELTEGRLELTEYAGSIGHNYSVTLNGRMLGAIVDNMDITVDNVFFDNAFLIVYEEKYLPLITALAVMAARELARDKDGALPNRL